MYHYIEGNIFETPAQTLVNTVNTVGAMGKGLAKEFKRLFPDMFQEYQKLCESKELNVGKLWLYTAEKKWVLNFPTKKHWRNPSEIEYIEMGLRAFAKNYEKTRINSIAFPKLGCGNGELDWKVVKPLMEKHLKRLPIDIYIYEIGNSIIPEHKDIKRIQRWLRSEPANYPFDGLQEDLKEIIRNSNKLTDMEGNEFTTKVDDNCITILQNQIECSVPWRGDEYGHGWLEIWQFMREKGVCSNSDLVNMGIGNANAVLGLLLRLSFMKRFNIIGKEQYYAIQLFQDSDELPLFRNVNQNVESFRL